ncbi:MAG: YggU family protein [Pseudomonadales bacterium]|nr:YggU family protein [Pseudomonadales bacterium]
MYHWEGDDLLMSLRVTPRASVDSLEPEDSVMRARIKAPPVDGKANQYLRKFLARQFGVAQSRVVIEKGETSRNKLVRICNPHRLPDGFSPA